VRADRRLGSTAGPFTPLVCGLLRAHQSEDGERLATCRLGGWRCRLLSVGRGRRPSSSGDYVDRIDAGAYDGCPDPDAVRGDGAERLVFAAWQEHVRTLAVNAAPEGSRSS
jgi:hypothetical protein